LRRTLCHQVPDADQNVRWAHLALVQQLPQLIHTTMRIPKYDVAPTGGQGRRRHGDQGTEGRPRPIGRGVPNGRSLGRRCRGCKPRTSHNGTCSLHTFSCTIPALAARKQRTQCPHGTGCDAESGDSGKQISRGTGLSSSSSWAFVSCKNCHTCCDKAVGPVAASQVHQWHVSRLAPWFNGNGDIPRALHTTATDRHNATPIRTALFIGTLGSLRVVRPWSMGIDPC
jgi:hypothetical protein